MASAASKPGEAELAGEQPLREGPHSARTTYRMLVLRVPTLVGFRHGGFRVSGIMYFGFRYGTHA